MNEAKAELKRKGYSIRTIYDPNKDKIEIEILRHYTIISSWIGYIDDCTDFLKNESLK